MSTKISKNRRAHLVGLCSPRCRTHWAAFSEVRIGGVVIQLASISYGERDDVSPAGGVYKTKLGDIVCHFSSPAVDTI